ncbi:hypothetical protein CFELI_01465 [Corynebacterium felinum]|nr:hypothetical protein CFELI_01465 [Corynebacterium felinum]
MFVAIAFLLGTFGLMSLVMFFIAKQSPKGKFGRIKWCDLPGIITPNTLSSREAWVAAHTAMSPYFLGLAYYFALSGVLASLCRVFAPEYTETAFLVLLFPGIAACGFFAIKGDRVASKVWAESKGLDPDKF